MVVVNNTYNIYYFVNKKFFAFWVFFWGGGVFCCNHEVGLFTIFYLLYYQLKTFKITQCIDVFWICFPLPYVSIY